MVSLKYDLRHRFNRSLWVAKITSCCNRCSFLVVSACEFANCSSPYHVIRSSSYVVHPCLSDPVSLQLPICRHASTHILLMSSPHQPDVVRRRGISPQSSCHRSFTFPPHPVAVLSPYVTHSAHCSLTLFVVVISHDIRRFTVLCLYAPWCLSVLVLIMSRSSPCVHSSCLISLDCRSHVAVVVSVMRARHWSLLFIPSPAHTVHLIH